MCSLATPKRIGRGIVIPGIDTKFGMDKPSMAQQYGGLHTPPQSAHESRRPSHQHLTMSEASYLTTSAFASSQPVTPIHSVSHGDESFVHGWAGDNVTGVTRETANAWPMSYISEEPLHPTLFSQSNCGPAQVDITTTSYQYSTDHTTTDVFGTSSSSHLSTPSAWQWSQHPTHAYVAHSAYLGSALFPMSQTLNLDPSPGLPTNTGERSSLHELDCASDVATVGSMRGFVPLSNAVYQNPQVVVPSQLSPQDEYSHHELLDYASPVRSNNGFSSSFGSSASASSGYEMMRPPSPNEAYFNPSDDDDWAMVKAENLNSPAYEAALNRSATSSFPVRSKRRSSRRQRSTTKGCWRKEFCGVVEVRCEGKEFSYKQVAGTNESELKWEPASTKPHVCRFVGDNGTHECGAGFDRSEHLKRHMGKHSSVRPYPCPLNGCKKEIQRPDNAGDHFKTHLRPKKKGKRNDHVEWTVLHKAIWDKYEDKKKAKKLLEGLRRWVDSGMPDTSGNRRSD